jgi:hypothetical protein
MAAEWRPRTGPIGMGSVGAWELAGGGVTSCGSIGKVGGAIAVPAPYSLPHLREEKRRAE